MGLDHVIKVREIIDIDEVYMRKENHIHNWAMNLSQAVDNDSFELTKEDLEDLRERLKRVNDTIGKDNFEEVAKKELPTNTDGLFFGSEKYDEWYRVDISNELNEVEKLLSQIDSLDDLDKDYTITYWSWW